MKQEITSLRPAYTARPCPQKKPKRRNKLKTDLETAKKFDKETKTEWRGQAFKTSPFAHTDKKWDIIKAGISWLMVCVEDLLLGVVKDLFSKEGASWIWIFTNGCEGGRSRQMAHTCNLRT